MPMLKTECFELDRRHLLKLTGTYGIGATFINPAALYAAGDCDKLEIENGEFGANQAGATLQFWIDGMHLAGRSDLPSRANITLFMDLTQSAASYVESVVLMDDASKTIAARYFDSSMKMIKKNKVPYVTFENIELDSTKTYYTVYSVKNGSTSKLYVAKIENPELSRLNVNWLPQKMRDDFRNFLVGNANNPTPGLITSQFQFYTRNGLATHTARGRMKSMVDDDFSVNIDFMHSDSNRDHYMRYFIVMDPVGRLLGFHRRAGFGDGGQTSGSLDVSKITEAQAADFNIPDLQIADIRDCPYIQFFTEDSFDAVARNIIRLR